ncbi:U3 small nucleolar RNA-associated protein [Chloropicon primus]|uniref:U3 small nucleolar RNA-associated protein n=3 Tax=Chloropicon primus TaxID=1764295 RepID=A0A5B8MQ79_9CHLO|nr:U3 small nucleolar RNA-associated protein [Chloropicon primus]|eukprot:QDZ22174.1 U3 small nucleolar RNA-associated protein [Chloropicon primus]
MARTRSAARDKDDDEGEGEVRVEDLRGISENLVLGSSPGKRKSRKKASRVDDDVVVVDDDDDDDGEGKRKRRKEATRAAELEDELFGRPTFAPSAEDEDDKATTSGDAEPEALFVIDTEGGRETAAVEEEEGGAKARKPAWVDEGEEDVVVDLVGESRRRKLRKDIGENQVGGSVFAERLREKYKELGKGSHSWAELSSKSRSAEGEERAKDALLRQTGSLLSRRTSVLQPQVVEATRVKDGNVVEPASCVLQAIDFHPKSLLMLTAGFDKMLRLFDVDGVHNPKVRAAFFEDLPIRRAKFIDEQSVLCTGRRPYCYKFNVETGSIEKLSGISGFERSSLENFSVSTELKCLSFLGRNGEVTLVSSKTNRKVADLRVDHRATCAAFTSDRELIATTSKGEVSRWDLRTYRCLDRFVDEGNLNATSLAVHPSWCAIGSESGVVNVYSGGLSSSKPKKAIMNLTTKVDALSFDQTGSILAMSSSMKRDSLRLVHLPTCTVFANWPTSKTPLHYVHCTAFSPSTGYVAVGNARGKCLLYRLSHFPEG